jgi:hypothetical protein
MERQNSFDRSFDRGDRRDDHHSDEEDSSNKGKDYSFNHDDRRGSYGSGNKGERYDRDHRRDNRNRDYDRRNDRFSRDNNRDRRRNDESFNKSNNPGFSSWNQPPPMPSYLSNNPVPPGAYPPFPWNPAFMPPYNPYGGQFPGFPSYPFNQPFPHPPSQAPTEQQQALMNETTGKEISDIDVIDNQQLTTNNEDSTFPTERAPSYEDELFAQDSKQSVPPVYPPTSPPPPQGLPPSGGAMPMWGFDPNNPSAAAGYMMNPYMYGGGMMGNPSYQQLPGENDKNDERRQHNNNNNNNNYRSNNNNSGNNNNHNNSNRGRNNNNSHKVQLPESERCTLRCTGIPTYVKEEDMKAHFEAYGHVVKIQISPMEDHHNHSKDEGDEAGGEGTNKKKTYNEALIQFYSPPNAKKCLSSQYPVLNNRFIRLYPSNFNIILPSDVDAPSFEILERDKALLSQDISPSSYDNSNAKKKALPGTVHTVGVSNKWKRTANDGKVPLTTGNDGEAAASVESKNSSESVEEKAAKAAAAAATSAENAAKETELKQEFESLKSLKQQAENILKQKEKILQVITFPCSVVVC